MIIVGSTALEQFGMNRNTPKDIDIWYSSSETISDNTDSHIIPDYILNIVPTKNGYATPDAIYTIKCSHLAWDIKWEKTKLDIIWLESNGCKLISELYIELKKYWETVHGNKDFLSLDKNKEDFFNDNVTYLYDHDYLHQLVAYPTNPTYTYCLRDGSEVLIDKSKFDCMSLDMQIRMFREEICVIAIERWLLHNRCSWDEAYRLALKKTITNLTKNWACDFIIHNLKHFVIPDYDYFKHAMEKLNMSNKVDLSIFKEAAEAIGYDGRLESFVFELAEGDISFARGYEFENKSPTWKLKEEDPEEYSRLVELHAAERKSYYEPYCDAAQVRIGYEHLDQDGGGEGGAEYCYGVFKLMGKVYEASYSYYSYNGYEYDYILDTLHEVKPVTKTITVYE